MKKLVRNINNQIEIYNGEDINWAISQGFKEMQTELGYDGNNYLKGYAPQKPLEQQLQEKKQEKHQELKSKRDKYLISNETNNNYDFSENDKFNIINLIGYTELEKQNYLEFIKSLKTQYDEYKELINTTTTINKLNKIVIEFHNKGQE